MYCNNCGKQVPNDASWCPYCNYEINVNRKQRRNNGDNNVLSGCLIGIVVFAIVISILVIIFTVGLDGVPTSTSGESQSTADTTNAPAKATQIYEDENIKVSFVSISDNPYLEEMLNVQILVENKSNTTYRVGLSEVSVNKMSTVAMSGVPMVIAPGEASQQPFSVSLTNTVAKKSNEVEKLKFRIYLMDDNDITKDMIETPAIEITF